MIHFITYGNSEFNNAKERICKEVKATMWFDTITAYGVDDLSTDFKKKFGNILQQRQGGGYWIWKPYIIKKKLDEINDNDILIYLDAGCTINPRGKKRFDEYIKMVDSSEEGIISFQMHHIEKNWTVKEIFEYFNVSMESNIACSGQIIGGVMVIKNNENARNIFTKALQCLHDNPLLFTNHYNNNNQESCFNDNRHDQSVLSLLRKIYGSILLKDESWFTPFGNDESLQYPFWAVRKR